MLAELSKIITSNLDINDVYERFATELKKVVDFDRLTTNIIDEEVGVFIPTYQAGIRNPERESGIPIPLKGSMTEQVLLSGQALVRGDIGIDASFPADGARIQLGFRSIALVPLVSKGRVIGVLGLHSQQVSAYGPSEQAVLERLASHIAPAVENARLYDELQNSTQQMAVVDGVARIITSTLDIDQVYEQFAEEMKKLVDFDRVYINIVDREADTYTIKYLFGQDAPGRFVGAVRSMAGTRTERVAKTGHTLISPADARIGQFRGDQDYFQAGLVSSIVVPLISKAQVIGTLGLRSRRFGAYGPREQAILERLANQIAPAVENAQLFEQSRQAEVALKESEERIQELATESVRAHEEECQWSALAGC